MYSGSADCSVKVCVCRVISPWLLMLATSEKQLHTSDFDVLDFGLHNKTWSCLKVGEYGWKLRGSVADPGGRGGGFMQRFQLGLSSY